MAGACRNFALRRRTMRHVASSADAESSARVAAIAGNLRIDAATAEVLRAFEAVGLRAVLLKGPALAVWYADDPARAYLDCDLWVAPADVEAAGEVLTRLGFGRVVDDRGLPAWWREHGTDWWRDLDGVAVDLHRRLQGLGVDDERAWQTLWSMTETLTVAGHPARVLGLPAKALYVTLHAAHHGAAWGKALSHLERALEQVDEPAWLESASLAERLGATDPFATGLCLVPQGAELAARLSLPETRSVEVALRASTPPPIALGFEQLARAASWRERFEVLAHKAVPPPGFIRHWWPAAGRNRGMLALGYVYRPIWLLRQAPRGLRAWLVARRKVRAGHSPTRRPAPSSPGGPRGGERPQAPSGREPDVP